MKIAIIISTNDPETVWNALRFAFHSITMGDSVKIFLLGKGVDAEKMDGAWNVKSLMEQIKGVGGAIYGCGTCMNIRDMKDTQCSHSTMYELHNIIKEADKVLTF